MFQNESVPNARSDTTSNSRGKSERKKLRKRRGSQKKKRQQEKLGAIQERRDDLADGLNKEKQAAGSGNISSVERSMVARIATTEEKPPRSISEIKRKPSETDFKRAFDIKKPQPAI